MMNEHGKSDRRVVPTKLPNNGGGDPPDQGAWLRSVLQGHYQYYGVPLNSKALQQVREEVSKMWKRSLSRRSHKGYIKVERMKRYEAKWLPVARICHPYPHERFGVMTQGRSPVR